MTKENILVVEDANDHRSNKKELFLKLFVYNLIEKFFGVPCVGHENSFDKRFPSWVAHM